MMQEHLVGVLVAALGGAAVGLERQWSGHALGPDARFGGLRTFTMLGGLGGLAGWLWLSGATTPAAVLIAGTAGIVVAAYAAASRRNVDATTEVAALVVITAGMIAGLGAIRLASAVIAVTSLLLVEKSRLHAFAARIDDMGLRAGVRFAVMALVVLPILPAGPYGPFGGIRPRELWALVLFFSGLSFLGYAARLRLGATRGYFVAGLLGGLISSTNVTFSFARISRGEPENARPLVYGVVAANAMLFPRVLVAVAVLHPALAVALAPYLALPAIAAFVMAAAGLRQTGARHHSVPSSRNPLQLAGALQMALIFQSVLMIVPLFSQWWGTAGLWSTAAALGLTDVDALTVSVAKRVVQTVSLDTAAIAIAIGIVANTVLKCGAAVAFGTGRFRWMTGAMLSTLALIAALAIVWVSKAF